MDRRARSVNLASNRATARSSNEKLPLISVMVKSVFASCCVAGALILRT